jgi:hypothetical protein
MGDLKNDDKNLSGTLEMDELLLRAQGRAFLESRTQPPQLFVRFVNPDKSYCEVASARIGSWDVEKILIRQDGETMEQFEQRVDDELPVGQPALVVMFGPEPTDKKNQTPL